VAHDACVTCRANRGEIPAPGGVIYEDALWRLEHTFEPIPMVGWLILKPLRHTESVADLTPDEAAGLGPLLQRVAAAMTEVLKPVKVYVSLYAEAENAAHIHIHLIPRHDGMAPDRLGPWVFHFLAEAHRERRNLGDVEAARQAAEAIREALRKDGAG
jgi:diadenosine tetraphosphate (Ap4A) HIT family hydrolase